MQPSRESPASACPRRRNAAKSRVRAAERQVPRRHHYVGPVPGDVLEHRLAGREIPVDVCQDGHPHGPSRVGREHVVVLLGELSLKLVDSGLS